MKKVLSAAIAILITSACYTPLNNSGVATTKPWLEIYGKKTDFNGKQYDSCYQFNVRFWPQEAADTLDLQQACISACCWRSDKEAVTLDFNAHFEQDLATYGRARKYTPGKITFNVNHANWLNTTRVSVSPQRAVRDNGLIKLKYKEYENPVRLAQLNEQARQATQQPPVSPAAATAPTAKKPAVSQGNSSPSAKTADPAKQLVQQQAGTKIDTYFYHMNKQYTKQSAVFLLSERLLHTQPAGENAAIVSCQAKARTGLDTNRLNASTFSCGQWWVDTQQQQVTPYDKRAKLIWNE